jgi:hypothetical protein
MTQENLNPPDHPSHVHIIVGNINGNSKKGNREERRNNINCNVFRDNPVKPDFIALQDDVRQVDVKSFINTLNAKWPGSEYRDVPERGKTRMLTWSKTAYKENTEGLLYDSNKWKRQIKNEEELFNSCKESQELLRQRCRFGVFTTATSEQNVIIMSYHGQWRKKRPKTVKLDVKTREAIFLSTII